MVGVDEWPRVLAGRLRAAALLGLPRFRWWRETRNPVPEPAPVARGQFFGLRIEWLTRDRAHGTEATPGHRLTNAGSSVSLPAHSDSQPHADETARIRPERAERIAR